MVILFLLLARIFVAIYTVVLFLAMVRIISGFLFNKQKRNLKFLGNALTFLIWPLACFTEAGRNKLLSILE